MITVSPSRVTTALITAIARASGSANSTARRISRHTAAPIPAPRSATTTAASNTGWVTISAVHASAKQYAAPAPARAAWSGLARRR
jgi:hypothetical protein